MKLQMILIWILVIRMYTFMGKKSLNYAFYALNHMNVRL